MPQLLAETDQLRADERHCQQSNEAMEVIEPNEPNIQSADASMPGVSDNGLTWKITEEFPPRKVILMSTSGERSYISQMIRHGA